MSRSRLLLIRNWEELAQQARYEVKGLAKLTNSSVCTVERFFKRHMGKPAFEWMRDVRQRWALTQVTTTDKPIKAIAYELGFKQPEHFSHQFIEYHGRRASDVQWEALMAQADAEAARRAQQTYSPSPEG